MMNCDSSFGSGSRDRVENNDVGEQHRRSSLFPPDVLLADPRPFIDSSAAVLPEKLVMGLLRDSTKYPRNVQREQPRIISRLEATAAHAALGPQDQRETGDQEHRQHDPGVP